MTDFNFLEFYTQQSEWSAKTFGPASADRLLGVVDHIERELIEIKEDPTDVKEWIDIMILALDGAWRAGFTPQEVIDAYVAKQTKNMTRVWPDWRTADPTKAIEHVRGIND